ncbi:Ig-like domain-containing protein [Sodalis ligni]|jgi:hypothetical protein|uniref:Big-1 domain-containing protein n=1 Tax=Sodalis ligni TaxID=2697027 RepID=A0A4R1NB53_9GAMM|nr:hypothetical protein [Sodalis ligni]TCL04664.1 hypothetical protein EZJ58_2795 [Sodalis ligni]
MESDTAKIILFYILTSPKRHPSVLTGKPGSNTSSTRIGVLQVAAQITAANLNATKNDSIANGSDYNKARFNATDTAGTLVAGQTVTFTATTAAAGTFHVVTPGINEGTGMASSIAYINARFSSFSMLIQSIMTRTCDEHSVLPATVTGKD